MATVNCIKSDLLVKLKVALKNRVIKLSDLLDKNSSEERRAVWEKVVPADVAKFINTQWEAAMAKESKTAIQNFVKTITTATDEKSGKRKSILDRIAKIRESGFFDKNSRKSTYTDIISNILGIAVTGEEIGRIDELSQVIEKETIALQTAEGRSDEFGDGQAKEWRASLEQVHIEQKTALKEMDKYMNGLTPTHTLGVITGSIFRGNMLFSLAPATINFISNQVQGVAQALERRMALRRLTGANNDYAIEYFHMIREVFLKTGYDMSREYAEDFRLGEHLVHNEGPSGGFAGAVRKVARGQAKIVFKYLLGFADVASAAAARADSANLQSAHTAGLHKLKGQAAKDYALKVFKQSTKSTKELGTEIEKEGFGIHTQSIVDAERATWTDKRWIAEKSLKFRDWLNDATGDLNLGFWTIPFVKTGANVIQFGIESSPIGFITGIPAFKKAYQAKNDPFLDRGVKEQLRQEAWRQVWRAGLGTIFSAALVGLLDPDDFFSAYDAITPAQRDQMGLKKGVYNAVKIGDKWVSMDFFGPLAPTMVGMMYAKKYGDGAVDTAFKFAQGAGQQTLQVPGLDDFGDLMESWKELLTAESLEEGGKGITAATLNSIRSRAIPGIVGTLAKATDPKVRKIDRKKLLDGIRANIPGLRQTLPAKVDITTGEDVKGEGFLTNLFFGSRVKTANESALIDEISRLEAKGEAPAIAEIERSSSKVKGLKRQIGPDRFQAALKWFGREYGQRATRRIRQNDYRKATDADKRAMLNKVRTETRAEMLKKFNFREPKKQPRR